MGRGDKRSRQGKIRRGSHGKRRLRKAQRIKAAAAAAAAAGGAAR